MADKLNLDMIEKALDLVAEWLIAAYGARIAAVSLVIEGHYGPIADCYGVVPVTLDRGHGPDGMPESRETLPTREVCEQAERLFLRLCPEIHFDHDGGRDVREVSSSRLVKASDMPPIDGSSCGGATARWSEAGPIRSGCAGLASGEVERERDFAIGLRSR